MTRLAVKEFCRRRLALASAPAPCVVATQRPREIAVGEQAVIVVGIAESKERRLTASRGAGAKAIAHRVRLDVYWIAADEETGGAVFDALLEEIDGVFRQAPMPVAVQDPESGAASVIAWIGEGMDTTVDEPALDDSVQGLIVFTAQKTLAVTEIVTG